MTMKRYFVIVILIAITIGGCVRTVSITYEAELRQWSGRLTLLTYDSSLYRLESGTVVNGVYRGEGTVERGDSVSPFRGDIPLSRIKYIQIQRSNGFTSVIAAVAGAFVTISAISTLTDFPEHGNAIVDAGYYRPGGGGGGGGSSCPLLYAWDGKEFVLQGEGFSVAWGSALEYASTHMIPAAINRHGLLSVRIANNRTETHYVNSMRVYALPVPAGSEVHTDPDGRFWIVRNCESPLSARDHSGRDILAAVRSADDFRWVSDLSPSAPGGTFEDTLTTVFTRRAEREASLHVRAINTRITSEVFAWAGQVVGRHAVQFVDRIENDPLYASVLKDWVDAASLRVEVWSGSSWEPAGRILPEANEVSFTKVLRVHMPDTPGRSIRIRLRTLCDVWEVDRLALDWSPAEAVTPLEARLVSAVDDNGADQLRALSADDSAHAMILPPHSIDLAYRLPEGTGGAGWTYALRIGGYLHEWLPDDGKETGPFSILSGDAKMEAMRHLLLNPHLCLPPIYAAWARARQ
jgi:hypothetical protein